MLFDFAVIGLGAVGSQAARVLAQRGHSVVGIDALHPPHESGSHHGHPRMLRESCYAGTPYLDLVREAREQWSRLQALTGRSLIEQTEALLIGPPESGTYGGTLASAAHSAPARGWRHLASGELREMFPFLRPPAHHAALLESDGGLLNPDACIEAALGLCGKAGAELWFGQPVLDWQTGKGSVTVETPDRRFRARRMLLVPGPSAAGQLARAALALRIQRTVQHWTRPGATEPGISAAEVRGRWPAWVWEHYPGRSWYGFPPGPLGVKVGLHFGNDRHCADRKHELGKTAATTAETEAMEQVLGEFAPPLSGGLYRSAACSYSMTPDHNFILDRHPDCRRVFLFAGGSGHAFKFAPVLGRMLADLASDRQDGPGTAPFRLSRFAN